MFIKHPKNNNRINLNQVRCYYPSIYTDSESVTMHVINFYFSGHGNSASWGFDTKEERDSILIDIDNATQVKELLNNK